MLRIQWRFQQFCGTARYWRCECKEYKDIYAKQMARNGALAQ
jgi:hypothetical protein